MSIDVDHELRPVTEDELVAAVEHSDWELAIAIVTPDGSITDWLEVVPLPLGDELTDMKARIMRGDELPIAAVEFLRIVPRMTWCPRRFA